MGRRAPRPLSTALEAVRDSVAPQTLLGEVQSVWAKVVGPGIAAAADPISERDGVLTLSCASAVWAAELDLMQADLLERLNGALNGGEVVGIRLKTGVVTPASRRRPA